MRHRLIASLLRFLHVLGSVQVFWCVPWEQEPGGGEDDPWRVPS